MENLNNVPSTGTFGGSINQVNQNFGLVKDAIENVEGRTIRSKGLFPTQAALTAAYPSPKVGDYAYVGSSLPATIYDCEVEGTWHNTQQQGGSESVPLNNYPTKSEMNAAIAAEAARNGYYQCTVSGTTLAVTAPGFTLPAHGGNIRIKMSAPATGACTLNINSTGAKALLYNGAAVSSTNTWEQNEIISVFYDPSGSGQYLATNSQGGGGKAEKIKYNNTRSKFDSTNVQDVIDEISEESALNNVSNTSEEGFFVADFLKNIVMKYTSAGFDVAKLSEHFVGLIATITDSKFVDVTQNGMYFVDSNLNVGLYIDSYGIHSPSILEFETIDY